MNDYRHRFPAVTEGRYPGWARFDGPAGTQVVDSAIEAAAQWQRSGSNANSHGVFAAARECDELFERAQATMGRLLNADPNGFMFGPSTTANVFSITRSIGHDLAPGDEVVCTRLDHDSNVAPWLLAADDSGATVRLAEFDTESGRLPTEAVVSLLNDRTRWVAVTGASNAIGSMPDIAAITQAAHEVGARVMVDGVHLTPHRPVDLAAIGCDVYSTSSYKWYGPHAGITWIEPQLLDSLHAYKVRPASNSGAVRLMLGTPSYEALAAIVAAAEFLLEVGVDNLATYEAGVFANLLGGLVEVDGVTVYGPHDLEDRAPTLAFNVEGHSPETVARHLAAAEIAVWDGNYYAVEVMSSYGIEGAVRAGVAAYVTNDDVDRLLTAVAELARS